MPKVLWEKQAAADARNRVLQAMRPLIVRGTRTMLIDAGLGDRYRSSHALLHVLAVAILDHHGLDTAPREEVTEHEARRPRADDPHLRAHQASSASSSTRWATAKAALAAGTPQ